MNIFEYNRWVENYRQEYGLLKFVNENYEPRALDAICFHGQQVIEKVLKSYLVLRGQACNHEEHDLFFLARRVEMMAGEKMIVDAAQANAFVHMTRFEEYSCAPFEYRCTERDVEMVMEYCALIVGKVEEMARESIGKAQTVDNIIQDAVERSGGDEYNGSDKDKDDGPEI